MSVIESIIHNCNHECKIRDNDEKLQKLISDYYFPDFMYYFKKWSNFEQVILETGLDKNEEFKKFTNQVFVDYKHYIHGNIVFMVDFLKYPREVFSYYDVYVYDKMDKPYTFSYKADFKRIMHKYYDLKDLVQYKEVLNKAFLLVCRSEEYYIDNQEKKF